MPHLVRWAKEFGKAGVVVIGNHVQRADDNTLISLCRRYRLNFPVTRGGRIQGVNVRGIPHMLIFDTTGQSVFEGHPMDGGAGQQLAGLVKSSPHWLLKGRRLEKLRRLGEALKAGRSYGRILRTARGRVKARDETEAEEAQYLVARLEQHANGLLERARGLEKVDPYEAHALYERIRALYAGASFADAAKKRLAELRRDKAFQHEVAAGKIGAKVLAACESLQPVRPSASIDLGDPACLKRNRRAAVTIVSGYRLLKKRYPETKAYEKVKKTLATYGLRD